MSFSKLGMISSIDSLVFLKAKLLFWERAPAEKSQKGESSLRRETTLLLLVGFFCDWAYRVLSLELVRGYMIADFGLPWVSSVEFIESADSTLCFDESCDFWLFRL